ncbi:MAG TPA: Ig-like domain-containing protein [Rhodothermales bacterium]|nr:Ig-like domain-containing protein [Rhodothermales bacterium]
MGDLFIVRCPDCLRLPVNNGSFAFGESPTRTPWQGDPAIAVEGVTEDITPCIYNRMLRFEASEVNRPAEDDIASTTFQLIDLRQTPLAEDVTFVARALVNRRQIDNETDRAFRLSLTAYAGDPATFDPASTNHQQLGGNATTLVADANPDTWEALFTELNIRSAEIDFLFVGIAAVEDVVNDRGNDTEFDAHFADLVRVGYTGVPHDLGLAFRALPTTVSQGSQVVFELTLTNLTPNIMVNGAGVATEFSNVWVSDAPVSALSNAFARLSFRYADHTGEGTYDPQQGTWHLDRLEGGASAKLYIAMQVTRIQNIGYVPWRTTATIIDSPNDQVPSNNRRTVSLSAPALPTIAPPLALSDTTIAVGDTLSLPLFENTVAPTITALQSHPEVASLSLTEEELFLPNKRYFLQVIGEQPGETVVLVELNTVLNGFTADFFNLRVQAPPVAHDDSYAVTQGQPLMVEAPGILENDINPGGNRLTAHLETPPTTGTLTLNLAGSFTYVPDAGFTGDAFTYHAADGAGDGALVSEVATVTLTPMQPNRPPVAVADMFEVEGNTSTVLDLLANDSDPDGDPIAVIASSPRTVENGMTEVIDGGQAVRYTPEAGFTGTDLFNYVIVDSSGLSSTETPVTVVVASPNRAPTVSAPINDITVSPDPSTSCSFDLDDHFTDPDGDALTYSASQSGGNATVNINGSNVTISGSDLNQAMVTITTEDPEGLTVSDIFAVQKVLSVTDCGGNRMSR